MSLRIKYLLASAASIVTLLLAYFLFDAWLMRSYLLGEQARSLRQVADLIHTSLDSSSVDGPSGIQDLLDRFGRIHPGLEVIILEKDSIIFAASQTSLVGRTWREPGIMKILSAESDFDWSEMNHHGIPVLDMTVPWKKGQQVVGAIHLARSLSAVDEQITGIQVRHTVFVVVVALLVGAFLSVVTYRLVIRRLSRLGSQLQASNGVGRCSFEEKGDEIENISTALRSMVGRLTETAEALELTVGEKDRLLARVERFNEELEREVQKTRQDLLATQKELVHAEHLSTIGQLAAGLAHELRNPLFIVRASAEKWRKKNPEAKALAQDIIEEVDRVNAIITGLLDLGRPLNLEHQPVDLGRVLTEVGEQFSKAIPKGKKIQFQLSCPEGAMVLGDPGLLRQAFSNIVDNSCDAIVQKGRIKVCVRNAQDVLEVCIEDDGQGIEPEDLLRVSKPFFTRKATGTGLGLAASDKIFSLHKTGLSFGSQPGLGTRVCVRLPRAES
jgi:signal transduction histidine kinase